MAWKIKKNFRVAERAGAKRGAPRRALPALKSKFRRLPKPTVKAVRNIVKTVIRRQAETKMITFENTSTPTSLKAGTTSLVGNYLIVSPSSVTSSYAYELTRGTDNSEIVGNKIRTKKVTMAMTYIPNEYNVTANPTPGPMMIRAYLFRSKSQPVTDLVTADFVGGTAEFFEDGNGYEGFQGNLMDLNRRVASDNFTYLAHRDFKLGSAIVSNTNTANPYYPGSNNDFRLNYAFSWNITKFLAKQYDLNDDNLIMTPYTFLLWQVIPAYPGVAWSANTVTPFTVSTKIQFEYQDY